MNDKQKSIDKNIKVIANRSKPNHCLEKIQRNQSKKIKNFSIGSFYSKKGFYNGQLDFCNFCRFEHLDSRECSSLLEHQIDIIFTKFDYKFIFYRIA